MVNADLHGALKPKGKNPLRNTPNGLRCEAMAVIFAEVAIEGTRPLLWHYFGTDAIPLEREAKKGVAGHNPQEWEKPF